MRVGWGVHEEEGRMDREFFVKNGGWDLESTSTSMSMMSVKVKVNLNARE